jgi:hypothetical protein
MTATETLTLNPDCTVSATLPGGEVLTFADLSAAESELDWRENAEQRGSNCRQQAASFAERVGALVVGRQNH